MRVRNTSIFMGDTSRSERQGSLQEEKKKSSTIFAGNLNKQLDPIAQKKQQARQQAMKIVSDAWEGERKIDEDIEDRRNKIAKLRTDMGTARKQLKGIEEAREKLRKNCGVEKDSQEEQDLKLLEKEMDMYKPGKGVSLSKEEMERIAQLKKNGLTQYQQRSLEMKESGSVYEDEIAEIEKQIAEESAVIRGTKLERLKYNPMAEANKQADAVLEAASDEIIGMLMEEAKNHIDEEMEEKKEAAEEKAEEEKEQEERLESIKEKKEEQKELTEAITDVTEKMLEMDGVKTDVQQEIKDMMNKMKLLEEDMKGAAIDETL